MQQTQVASDKQHADYRRKHLAAEAELQQEVAVLTQAKAVLSERLSELNALTGKQSVDLLQVGGWVLRGECELLCWVMGSGPLLRGAVLQQQVGILTQAKAEYSKCLCLCLRSAFTGKQLMDLLQVTCVASSAQTGLACALLWQLVSRTWLPLLGVLRQLLPCCSHCHATCQQEQVVFGGALHPGFGSSSSALHRRCCLSKFGRTWCRPSSSPGAEQHYQLLHLSPLTSMIHTSLLYLLAMLALQTRAHLAQLQAVAQEQSKTATDRVHAMQYDVTTMQERLETAEASAA